MVLKVQKTRAREKIYGTTDQIYTHTLNTINSAQSFKDLEEATSLGVLKLDQVPLDYNREVIKIGLIGEIYTLLEPFINLELEKELGIENISEEIRELNMGSKPFLKSSLSRSCSILLIIDSDFFLKIS